MAILARLASVIPVRCCRVEVHAALADSIVWVRLIIWTSSDALFAIEEHTALFYRARNALRAVPKRRRLVHLCARATDVGFVMNWGCIWACCLTPFSRPVILIFFVIVSFFIAAYAFVVEEVRGLVWTLRNALILLCIQVRKPLGTRGTSLSSPVRVVTTPLTDSVILGTSRVIFYGRAFLGFYEPHLVFWTCCAFL